MDERPKSEKGSHQILVENTGINLLRLGHRNFLLDISLKAKETKAKMNYWDFIKIKSFCTAKEKESTKLKDNRQNRRRYLQMTYQIKAWYPNSIKNLSNSTPKKQIIQSRNGQKTGTDISAKET